MATATTKSENVKFLTIEEFKNTMNLKGVPASVVRNPNGENKLFLAIGSQNFKCQQSIDPKLEMRMLIEDGAVSEACLVNVKSSTDNVLFSL